MSTVADRVVVPGTPPATRTHIRVLRVVGVVAAALGLSAFGLAAAEGRLDDLLTTPEAVVAPSFGAVAVWLAGHRQAWRIAVIFGLVAATAGIYAFSSALTMLLAGGAGPTGPLHLLVGWLTTWTWVPPLGVIVTVLPLVVPEGRSLGGRWWMATWASWALLLVASAFAALVPRPLTIDPARDNPFGVAALEPLAAPVGLALLAAAVVLGLAGLASLVVRFRRSTGAVRRQVAWFGYGVAGTVLATALAPPGVRMFAVLLIPASVLVAALRYRLYDIDRLVNATAVAGVLLAGAAAVYAAVAGWAAVLLGQGTMSTFVAAFTIALLFHPARVRVQRLIDRLLIPERLDPHQLTLELNRVLHQSATPRQALDDLTRTLRTRLRTDGVTVHRLPAGAEAEGPPGSESEDAVSCVPLRQHGALLGWLVLSAPAEDSVGLMRNPALHAAMAGPLTAALHAWQLSQDLESSRRSIVSTREEERRRLRRDLHDGLGPQLATVAMTLATARHVLARGRVDRADHFIQTGIAQAQTAVIDVRTLVSGLRPPALDELGLAGALRSVGPAVLADEDAATVVDVDCADDLGPVSAAAEVAAYRIAQEAMTNAVRHGRAGRVRVALDRARDGALRVTVTDDGAGFEPGDLRPGVGLRSMSERAAELGGTLDVTSAVGQGTTVVGTIPDRKQT